MKFKVTKKQIVDHFINTDVMPEFIELEGEPIENEELNEELEVTAWILNNRGLDKFLFPQDFAKALIKAGFKVPEECKHVFVKANSTSEKCWNCGQLK